MAISQYAFFDFIAVAFIGQMIVLPLLVWHCVRRFLALGREMAMVTAIVAGIIQHGCGMFVVFITKPLLLAALP